MNQDQNFILPPSSFLLGFLMIRVFTAASAELLELQTIRSCLLVLRRHVIAALTVTALQYNVIAWHKSLSLRTPLACSIRRHAWARLRCYSTTSETVPAPTVRPPSRIAKRK